MLDKNPVNASIESLSQTANATVKDTARYPWINLEFWIKSGKRSKRKVSYVFNLAFTNWINNYLKECNAKPIVDLASDFSDGENLILLLQVIGNESLGKYNRNPRIRIQKVENVNKALAFIKERGVALTNIGGEDIVDGNEKLILGLIWSLILRFSIAEIR
jgi:hypothetical protein